MPRDGAVLPRDLPGRDVYTFGDNPTAARRLALLARLFGPSARAFLGEWAPPSPRLVIDLGCGPGHTTRLLREELRPERIVGLDLSTGFLRLAVASSGPATRYVRADVSRDPLPVRSADLLYGRYLLAHLADPVRALRAWMGAVRRGGRVMVQETARLTSPVREFRRYYELLARLQRHHGQEPEIGARLGTLAASELPQATRVLHVGLRSLRLPATAMARLHVMNLRTWRGEPFVQRTVDAAELDELEAWLGAAATGGVRLPPVEQDLGELVLERG